MKNSILLVALALLTGLSACAPAVNVEQRANVDFSRYRTYAWADTKVKTTGDVANPLYQDPIAQDRIRMAIDREMVQRNLRKLVKGRPDFYITTHFFVENAERTVANPTYPGAGYAYPYAVSYGRGFIPVNYGYYYRPAYYQSQTYRTETYKQGTLVIDFIDGRTNNLVWRGSLADPVDDPARLGSEFTKNAKDILDKFPIPEVKKS